MSTVNVHIQRPVGSPLLTGLTQYVEILDKTYNLRNKTMIEIGCYQGESTEVFSGLFSKIYAVDPWQNGYDPSDHSSYVTQMNLVEQAFDNRMKGYSGLVKNKTTSAQFFESFDQIVDFVYIDGNHTYDAIVQDLTMACKFTKYIGGHDWGMASLDQALKKFLKVDTLAGYPIHISPDSSWIINQQFV